MLLTDVTTLEPTNEDALQCERAVSFSTLSANLCVHLYPASEALIGPWRPAILIGRQPPSSEKLTGQTDLHLAEVFSEGRMILVESEPIKSPTNL